LLVDRNDLIYQYPHLFRPSGSGASTSVATTGVGFGPLPTGTSLHQHKHSLPVAGIVAGALGGLVLIILAIFFWIRQSRPLPTCMRQRSAAKVDNDDGPSEEAVFAIPQLRSVLCASLPLRDCQEETFDGLQSPTELSDGTPEKVHSDSFHMDEPTFYSRTVVSSPQQEEQPKTSNFAAPDTSSTLANSLISLDSMEPVASRVRHKDVLSLASAQAPQRADVDVPTAAAFSNTVANAAPSQAPGDYEFLRAEVMRLNRRVEELSSTRVRESLDDELPPAYEG
jgi:hypothetical protein